MLSAGRRRALRVIGEHILNRLAFTEGAKPLSVLNYTLDSPAWHPSNETRLHQSTLLRQSRASEWKWRELATKAEEYDVISLESGLAVIDGYDGNGFTVNGAYHPGSVMCSGSLVTMWNVQRLADLNEEAFSLLLLMKPAPDLLVLGCGKQIQQVKPQLLDWLADHGIALECLDTGNAVSTFNILNQESRKVVAALLPSQ